MKTVLEFDFTSRIIHKSEYNFCKIESFFVLFLRCSHLDHDISPNQHMNLGILLKMISGLEDESFLELNVKCRVVGYWQSLTEELEDFSDLFEIAMNMNSEKLGAKQRLTLCRARDLATSHIQTRKYSEAKKLLNVSIRRAKSSLGEKDLLTLRLYELYGLCLLEEKEYERAVKTFEKVASIREEEKGFGNLSTILCNKIREIM